ncbi:MAG: hypothetical protein ACRDKF_10275 [Actinomycetota bacterium]
MAVANLLIGIIMGGFIFIAFWAISRNLFGAVLMGAASAVVMTLAMTVASIRMRKRSQ